MKAIIIDDEWHVIAAIKLLVDWKRFHIDTILESSSAADALPLIRAEHPEIIITDVKMPNVTGLELIRRIMQFHPAAKIIVVSGYDNYEYMRSAMQEGCVDYILKPIQEKQINDAIGKALEQYSEDAARLALVRSANDIRREQSRQEAQRLLLRCFSSMQPHQAWEEFVQYIGPLPKFCVGVMEIQHFPPNTIAINNCLESFAGRFNDILHETGHGAATVVYSSGDIILVFGSELLRDKELFEVQLDQIYNETGIHMHLGISCILSDAERIKQARDEARINATSYNLLNSSERVHFSAPALSEQMPFNLLWFEKQLYSAILSQDHEVLASVAHLCVKRILRSGYCSIRQLKHIQTAYCGCRLRWIESFHLDYPPQSEKPLPEFWFHMPFLSDGTFSEELLERGLLADISAVADYFAQLAGNHAASKRLLVQIRQYLCANYAQKITLASLAERFSLNSSYLSRAFKQYFHTGVMEYLADVRMAHAADLLENQRLSVWQIAVQTGYDDERYFSRVFKKKRGVSPREYRKGIQQKS